jgi:integrase
MRNPAWVVDYADAKGKRRLKTFKLKKDADRFAATASVEVREGIHIADSESATVAQAGAFWLASCDANGLERSTVDQYRQHLTLHIAPFIGQMLLSKLTVPIVRGFEDELRKAGRSPQMVKKALSSLSMLLSDAQERGLAVRNPVRDMRAKRQTGSEGRQKAKLRVGVDIPSRDEIRAIVGALEGRWRPLLLTAIFTGLRASELRGLPWSAVDLDNRSLSVFQRADRYNKIGRPKSGAGDRTVPLTPMVVNTLREWKLACPRGELDLVFPNGSGNVESLGNIVNRALKPPQERAGAACGRQSQIHWHACAPALVCIMADQPGGGWRLRPAAEDCSGAHGTLIDHDDAGRLRRHLFPRGDDADELAAAEASLLSIGHDNGSLTNSLLIVIVSKRTGIVIIIRVSGVQVPPPLPLSY